MENLNDKEKQELEKLRKQHEKKLKNPRILQGKRA